MAAGDDRPELLRMFELHHMGTTNPAVMGAERIQFGTRQAQGLTFEQGFAQTKWVLFLLRRKGATTAAQDRFLSYVRWRMTPVDEMNANIQDVPQDPKDTDHENHKTRSSASNPTKETDQTVEAKPLTCSSSNPKVPTVQTALKTDDSEEEDDLDWEPVMNAQKVTELERLIACRMDNLERVISRHHSLNNERLHKIDMNLAEIIRKTFN